MSVKPIRLKAQMAIQAERAGGSDTCCRTWSTTTLAKTIQAGGCLS